MHISEDVIEQANKRAAWKKSHYPAAVAVRYDQHLGRIIIELTTGVGILIAPRDLQGFQDATLEELSEAEISPSGFGIHFPKLDADVYLPRLLEGFLGTELWMAERKGQR